MTPISYNSIRANVAKVNVDAGQVQVSWKCPATGRMVGESTAYMSADPSLGARMGASVQRSVAQEVIYGAARFVSSFLGGAAGRVVTNAVYTAAADINDRATQGADYSDASRQAAIVAAFEQVKDSFNWDDKRRQFVAREGGDA